VVETAVRGNLTQDLCPDDAVFVARPQDALVIYPDEAVTRRIWVLEQAAASEHEAPETFRCTWRVRRQGILICLYNCSGTVYGCCPSMSHNYVGVLVERIDAAL